MKKKALILALLVASTWYAAHFSSKDPANLGIVVGIAIILVFQLANALQTFVLDRVSNRYASRAKAGVLIGAIATAGLVASIAFPLGVVALLLAVPVLPILLAWCLRSFFSGAQCIVKRRASITRESTSANTDFVAH